MPPVILKGGQPYDGSCRSSPSRRWPGPVSGAVGTYHSWVSKTPGLRFEGFDVYTEVIPNRRITDMCSASVAGYMTYSFEPEGSGMQLTLESHPRSFWRIPPLKELVERVQSTEAERLPSAVKARMEA